ncbi:hypothetical protein WAI453_001446 [Rhynchosporium graminicola]
MVSGSLNSYIYQRSGIFIFLHTAPHDCPAHRIRTEHSHHGATPLMNLHPLIYTVCTAPLAAGQIYAIAGREVSLGFFVVAGTMIALQWVAR